MKEDEKERWSTGKSKTATRGPAVTEAKGDEREGSRTGNSDTQRKGSDKAATKSPASAERRN